MTFSTRASLRCFRVALESSGIVHSDDAQHHDHAARLSKNWNATVAVSEKIAHRLRQSNAVEPSRLAVIPYGVAASRSLPTRPAEGALRILYSGRLESTQKRINDLIAIASGLEKRGTPFRMTIVGDGPQRAALEREVSSRDLSRCVTLLKPVGNDRILEICRDHDVFVLPSAYEGMPIGLLEAMGQGCIPVATDIESGIPELIQSGANGFIVGVGRIDEFVDRLDEIAKSPSLRTTMSDKAWTTVSTGRFAPTAMISRYLEVFEDVSREMALGTFKRTGAMRPAGISLRDRIAAPLWYLRPSIRAQQKVGR